MKSRDLPESQDESTGLRWLRPIGMVFLAIFFHLLLAITIIEKVLGVKIPLPGHDMSPGARELRMMPVFAALFFIFRYFYSKRVPTILEDCAHRDFSNWASVAKNFIILWLPAILVLLSSF